MLLIFQITSYFTNEKNAPIFKWVFVLFLQNKHTLFAWGLRSVTSTFWLLPWLTSAIFIKNNGCGWTVKTRLVVYANYFQHFESANSRNDFDSVELSFSSLHGFLMIACLQTLLSWPVLLVLVSQDSQDHPSCTQWSLIWASHSYPPCHQHLFEYQREIATSAYFTFWITGLTVSLNLVLSYT